MNQQNKIFAIAIDAYWNIQLVSLDNPVGDANRLIKVLQEKYNYTIAAEPLFDHDATKTRIEEKLFSFRRNSDPEDVLIIFFAGHGGKDEGSQDGFWHPIDGQEIDDVQDFVWNATVLQTIRVMKFKHVLLITDSCYSGTFIPRTRVMETPATMEDADQLESRWVFVSGGEERVGDGAAGKGSPFMNSVYQFLETNQKKRFPATDLFDAVKRDAENYGWKHNPNAAPLPMQGHKGGVLVFERNDISPKGEENEAIKPFPPPAGPALAHYIPRTVSPRNQDTQKEWFFGVEPDSKRLIDVMQNEQRVVLLGNAGSGKSRELERLWQDVTGDPGRFLPIYKRFNTYIDQQLGEFLPDGGKEVDPYMAFFILDGLDEVQPQYFSNAIRSIEEFLLNNPQARVVISCRTNFYELPGHDFSGTLSDFSVYKLNDISLKEIRDYATGVKRMDGNEFVREINENRFGDLASKPFFLEVLLRYYENRGNLNASRSAVIEETLKAQIASNRKHLHATAIGRQLTTNVALDMLEKIGFIMEQMGKNNLPDRELRAIFSESNSYEMVQALPAFYLNEEQNTWQFDHNNVQEFLAASVLKTQDFGDIIRLVTTTSGKIKPGWVNTLSFFVSIGGDAIVQAVLAWMVEHDPEFIFRFEPERIPDEWRKKLAIELIQMHAKENIWFSSSKYSEEDIARMGAYPEVIELLLADLERGATRTVISNAFRVLRYMDWERFPAEKERFKASLLNILFSKTAGPDDFIYSILNVIGDLQFAIKEEVDRIITKYRNSINAFIRAGLYSLINSYGLVDDYIDVFIDGLNLEKISEPTDARSDVSLLDEQVRWFDGITKVQSFESIRKLLLIYNKPGSWRNFSRDEDRAFLDNIVKQATALYPHHGDLYGMLLTTLKDVALHGMPEDGRRITTFFKNTGSAFRALMDVLSEASDYIRAILYSFLVDAELVPVIISAYRDKTISESQIDEIYKAINWNSVRTDMPDDILVQLGDAFFKASGKRLERPAIRRWEDIQRKTAQESFDVLFDRERFKEGIKTFYGGVGKTTITWDDVIKVRAQVDGSKVPDAIFSFISNFFRGRQAYPMVELLEFVDTSGFEWYAVHQAYQSLERGTERNITVGDNAIAAIVDWCKETASSINVEKAIRNSAEVVMVLWYFIRELNVTLPNEQLLPFTLYYDFRAKIKLQDKGSIDVLATKVGLDELHKQVLSNLAKEDLPVLAWLNNASYAVSAKFVTGYPLIMVHILATEDRDYKYNELLDWWFEVSGNLQMAREVLTRAASVSLRLAAAKILAKVPAERGTVAEAMVQILGTEDATEDEKLTAARRLAVVGDVRGIAFITEKILSNVSRLDRAHMEFGFALTEFKSLNALPYVFQLISIALAPELRPRDRHGFFFSKVLEALYNIGMQSRAALDELSRMVTVFISENEGKLVDLEVLKVNLRRMEEQFSAKEDHSASLETAIRTYREMKRR